MDPSGVTTMSWAVACGAAWLLTASGIRHVLGRRRLLGVLAAQRFPLRFRRMAAAWLGPLEVALGAAVLAAVASGTDAAVVTLVCGALYVVFAGYLVRLQRVAPGAPCGCLSDDESASPATTARAAMLGGACLLAAGLHAAQGAPEWAVGDRLAVLAGGVVVALMAATLPGLPLRAPQPGRVRP